MHHPSLASKIFFHYKVKILSRNLINPHFHYCLIIPCLWLAISKYFFNFYQSIFMKSSLNSNNWLTFKKYIGGNLLSSATIHSITVMWILSWPRVLILTSFESIIAIDFVLVIFINNGVCLYSLFDFVKKIIISSQHFVKLSKLSH